MPTTSAVMILKKCFHNDGDSLKEFAIECRGLKKLPDYREFVEECAEHLGLKVSWDSHPPPPPPA